MTAWRLSHLDDTTDLSARAAPDRWDVRVERAVPALPCDPAVRTRLAYQIRQDIWRAAQRVRGFVPRVRIVQTPAETLLIAGGAILTGRARPNSLPSTLAGILDNGMNRRRWVRHAARAARGTSHVRQDPDRE